MKTDKLYCNALEVIKSKDQHCLNCLKGREPVFDVRMGKEESTSVFPLCLGCLQELIRLTIEEITGGDDCK
jgi:hypothetical protein